MFVSTKLTRNMQFNEWKAKLPLETLRRMLHVLVPQIEKLCADRCALISVYIKQQA